MNDPGSRPATRPEARALLIDARATTAVLTLSARTLWTLTQRRAIPSHRIGRLVRYSPVELEAWVAAGCPTNPNAADRIRQQAVAP